MRKTLSPVQIRMMKHALGLDIASKSNRNSYVVHSSEKHIWEQLEKRGLAERTGERLVGYPIYRVTKTGKQRLFEEMA